MRIHIYILNLIINSILTGLSKVLNDKVTKLRQK